MQLGLRTTIFWNMFILMVLAIVLSSFVVFRISEREVGRQRFRAGEDIFASIKTSVTHILQQNRGSAADATRSELRKIFFEMTAQGICRSIILVGFQGSLIARSDKKNIGAHSVDMDIRKAMSTSKLVKKTYPATSEDPARMVVCAPVYYKGKPVAVLKAVFSLLEVQQHVKRSFKMVLMYIIFDALVLIAFGTFLMSRYLAKPLRRLIRLTEDITQGNIDGNPLFLSERSEIGQLSAAIKAMTEKLKEEKNTIQRQLNELQEKNLQLGQAHSEIIQAEKLASVGSLAAGVAHEIGNPIGIVLGYVHMLREHNLDDVKRIDYLNRAEDAAGRVNTVIRDLLDYAQPSSKSIGPINLNDVLKDTFALVSYQKKFKNITPIFQLTRDLPVLSGDEKQIRQLVVNLLLNAGDAMTEGGSVTLSTGLDGSAKEETVYCAIADSGSGITPDHRNKVFDPFFTTKEQGHGTGLGLSNVQRIVETAGGRIRLESTPGRGSTFTIFFPTGNNI